MGDRAAAPVMKRPLLAGLAILIAWMLLDLLIHRTFLAPVYEATKSLWRPFDQMNVVLIYTATIVLIGIARNMPPIVIDRWAMAKIGTT